MPRYETPITAELPNIRVRLEVGEYERLVELARLNDRSLAAEARIAIRAHLRAVTRCERNLR